MQLECLPDSNGCLTTLLLVASISSTKGAFHCGGVQQDYVGKYRQSSAEEMAGSPCRLIHHLEFYFTHCSCTKATKERLYMRQKNSLTEAAGEHCLLLGVARSVYLGIGQYINYSSWSSSKQANFCIKRSDQIPTILLKTKTF